VNTYEADDDDAAADVSDDTDDCGDDADKVFPQFVDPPRIRMVSARTARSCEVCQKEWVASIDTCIYCWPNNISPTALVCRQCLVLGDSSKRKDQPPDGKYKCRYRHTGCQGFMVKIDAAAVKSYGAQLTRRFEMIKADINDRPASRRGKGGRAKGGAAAGGDGRP
jgi:hypothetical protein